MIHTYELLGRRLALDVESGAIHSLDETAYGLLQRAVFPLAPACPEEYRALAPDADEAWAELYTLQEAGLLDSHPADVPAPEKGPLKALCLHVSHDCNLRCGYCFAGTGHFGGQRSLMSPETGRAAIDFLLAHSGGRRNLEIDFFGGEPLLALDTVKKTVDYARAREKDAGKHFRFTLTTNGLLLDGETIAYLNETMDNLVLSADGRPETHDALRKTTDRKGSYAVVMPAYRALTADRRGSYFIRGTFTHRNPDFVEDLLHLADEGFASLSLEPVVLPGGHKLAITNEDVPVILAAYERLAAHMLAWQDDPAFTFFHFEVDLQQGPCVYKRIRGCGAGVEYAAVTPDGDLYPCHQFVGKEMYRLGSLREGIVRTDISDSFAALNIRTKPDCAACWAKYYCSGGCVASNLTTEGALEKSDRIGCALERKRLECAILLQTERLQKSG